MTTTTPPRPTPKPMLWTGRILSAIPILMMGGMGTVMLLTSPNKILDGMTKYGYPAHVARPLVILEIICAVLYLIPQTAVLGAILLTAYLGGAVATHVRASEQQFWFPIAMGALVWLGLFLRDARIRKLVPFRF